MIKPDAVKAFGMLMEKEEDFEFNEIRFRITDYFDYEEDKIMPNLDVALFKINKKGEIEERTNFMSFKEVTRFLEGK